MNVQDVIDKALNGESGIAVVPAEHSSCEDGQIAKLAAALNFIGTNLEDSVLTPNEILAQADLLKEASSGIDFDTMGTSTRSSRGSGTSPEDAIVYNPPEEKTEDPKKETKKKKSKSKSAGEDTRLKRLGKMTGMLENSESALKRGGRATATGAVAGLAYLGGKKVYDKYKSKSKDGQKKTASVDDVLRHAAISGKRSLQEKAAMLATGGDAALLLGTGAMAAPSALSAYGAHRGRELMREAGMSEREIEEAQSVPGGAMRGALRPVGYGLAGAAGMGLLGAGLGKIPGIRRQFYDDAGKLLMKDVSPQSVAGTIGGLGGLTAGALGGYHQEVARAKKTIDNRNKKKGKGSEKKASLQKLAEDRINPAKITAGKADPFSGEIMPDPGKVSSEFIGSTRDHKALVALKAQKVRNRINKDMKQYVSNVGDGYNLQGHLTKFNK